MLVHADSPATTLADLRGKAVGVKSRSTGEKYMNGRSEYRLWRMSVSSDLLEHFKNGALDAVVFDKPIIDEWLAQGLVRGRSLPLGEQEEYAIAYRKEDTQLGRKIDHALDKLIKSGRLEEIQKKWLISRSERPSS